MTDTRRKILIIFLVTVLTAVLAAGTVLAVNLSFSAAYNPVSRADTSSFTVGIGGNGTTYYTESSVSGSSFSLNIDRLSGSGALIPDKADILIFADTQADSSGYVAETFKSALGVCTLFSQVVYTENMSFTVVFAEPTHIRAVAVPYDSRNRYVDNLFALKMLNDDKLYDSAVSDSPDGKFQDYKNIYFVGDVSVDYATELNCPAFIHLLYSKLTLNADLKLKHPYSGIYALDAFDTAAVNGEGSFTVETPRAFYTTANFDRVTADTVAVNMVTEVDFANDTLKFEKLIDDAKDFARKKIGSLLFDDTHFVSSFHSYGITYSYSVANVSGGGSLSEDGNIVRGQANGIFEITMDLNFNGKTVSTSKFSATVCGLSQAAHATNISAYLTEYFSKVFPDRKMVGNAEMASPLKKYCALSGFDGNAVLKSEGVYVAFELAGKTASEITLKSEVGKVTFSSDGINFADGILYITRPDKILEEVVENVSVAIGADKSFFYVSTSALSGQDKRLYLGRFLDAPFFTSASDTAALLYLSDNKIKLGGNDTVVAPSYLSYTAIKYQIFLVGKKAFEAITDEASLLEVISNKIADYTNMFSVKDGMLSPESNVAIRPTEAQTLMLYVTFEGEDAFSAYRGIILPEGGLGGNEFTEYIKGDTFKPYFNSLSDGKLIDSVSGESGSAFKFTSEFSTQVLLRMSIETADISDFCKIVSHVNPSYCQIDIDVTKIPSSNTSVDVLVEFYIEVIKDGAVTENIISTQRYKFIIPGIYRSGIDFDPVLYTRAVEAVDNSGNPLYGSYAGYLLSDGAKNKTERLDLTKNDVGNISSLKGIELLSGTSSFIFDGNAIADISSLKLCSDRIRELSLKNCMLTDALLQNGRPLFSLNSLNRLDISGNLSVTSLSGANGILFYRTVKYVYASQCSINSLDGIEAASELVYADISGNRISLFGELTKLLMLQKVYLGGNIAADFSGKQASDSATYYGTAGKLNVPIYVTLLNKGVAVNTGGAEDLTIKDGSSDVREAITSEQLYSALVLNALSVPSVHYGYVALPQYVYTGNAGGTTYEIDLAYVLSGNSAITDFSYVNGILTLGSTVSDGELTVILSATHGSYVGVKAFKLTYVR